MSNGCVRRPSKVPGLSYSICPPKGRFQRLSIIHERSGLPIFAFPRLGGEVIRQGEMRKVIDEVLLSVSYDWNRSAAELQREEKQAEAVLRKIETCVEQASDLPYPAPASYWRVKEKCRPKPKRRKR